MHCAMFFIICIVFEEHRSSEGLSRDVSMPSLAQLWFKGWDQEFKGTP